MHLAESYLGNKQGNGQAKVFGAFIVFLKLCPFQLNNSAMVLRGLVKLYQMGEMEAKSKRNQRLQQNNQLLVGTAT